MKQAPFDWRRGPRSSFSLGSEIGVYALFLREEAVLPDIEPCADGLVYIGLAASRTGLKGPCHFDARTRNHSPRKSLAVLLMEELALTPELIVKPSSPNTWGLDRPSDARLSAWMHDNLELAIEVCSDPDGRETELVSRYAPPLNLTKCVQTDQHRRISTARSNIMAELQGRPNPKEIRNPGVVRERALSAPTSMQNGQTSNLRSLELHRQFAGADIDTAEAIAARFGLNPKSYRQRLRDSIFWYRKPQDWTFHVGSNEWNDMIAVAERMRPQR